MFHIWFIFVASFFYYIQFQCLLSTHDVHDFHHSVVDIICGYNVTIKRYYIDFDTEHNYPVDRLQSPSLSPGTSRRVWENCENNAWL